MTGQLSLFDTAPAEPTAPRPAPPPPPPRPMPRLAAMYASWRDALLRVAASERAYGCEEAARVCEAQAAIDHGRMLAALNSP